MIKSPDLAVVSYVRKLGGSRPRSNGDNEIRSRSRADIHHSVLIIRVHESDIAWSQAQLLAAIHGDLDRALANQPHLRVHVMMRAVRHAPWRQRSLVYFDKLPGGQTPLHHGAKLITV